MATISLVGFRSVGSSRRSRDICCMPSLMQVKVNFNARGFFETAMSEHFIDISELAARSGLAASALRFYESAGLIEAVRSASNRRRFPRSTLRKVAFIRAAQNVGLTLDAIKGALDGLPSGRSPTKDDWEGLSSK